MSSLTKDEAAPAGAPAGAPVLEVSGVTLRFGGLTSLDDVSLTMTSGSVLAVIGPNGAGKTSLFNCLTGAYQPQQGKVVFHGAGGSVSILGRKPHKIARLGIARTFQNIRLFPALTALENVQVAIETLQHSGPISHMLGLPRSRRDDRESAHAAHALLERVGLRRAGQHPRCRAPVRRAAAAGDRPRARYQTTAPAAGRARGRDQPHGEARALGSDPQHRRRAASAFC